MQKSKASTAAAKKTTAASAAKKKVATSRKTNRTRKSQCQKDALWELYKVLKGETPSRTQIENLSNELNLKENQIYKWFWDTKKKVDEDTEIAKKTNFGGAKDKRQSWQQASRNSFTRQDSQGHLMKPKASKECIGVDGKVSGELMTPQQIKTALKIH